MSELKLVVSSEIDESSADNDVLFKMKEDINEIMEYFILPSDNLQGSFSSKEAVNKITDYYKKYQRILYSEVTVFVINLLKEHRNSDITFMIANLDSCFHYCLNDKNKVQDGTTKTILKLWDHVNLANNQYLSFYQEEDRLKKVLYPDLDDKLEKVMKDHTQLTNSIQNTSDKLNDVSTRVMDKIQNERGTLITEMVSMVSIFVGIAFVMFGGMTLLNNLFDFSNMKYVPVTELLCLGSLIGMIMIGCIYAFIIFVLKLTDKHKNLKGNQLLDRVALFIFYGLFVICLLLFICWLSNPSYNMFVVNRVT